MPHECRTPRNRFGKLAVELRTQVNLSFRGLAREIGVSYQLLYLIETDKSHLTLDILKGYIKTFRDRGVSEDKIETLIRYAALGL